MTSAMKLPGVVMLSAGLVLAAGCGSSSSGGSAAVSTGTMSETAAPSTPATVPVTSAPANPATSDAGANGRADLVFSGAITQHMNGAPASCNYYYPSEKRGAVYTVDAATFSLQVSDSEGDGRTAVILNATAPQDASYTSRTDNPGTVVVKLDLSGARLDVDLRNVVGSQTVHVSGTITCSG